MLMGMRPRMRRPALLLATALGLLALAGACDGTGGSTRPDRALLLPPDGSSDAQGAPGSDGGAGARDARSDHKTVKPDALAPRAYPDVTAAKVNCSTWVVGDKAQAKAIYDAYFGSYLPKTTSDFQWHADSSILTSAIVQRVTFYPPTTGQSESTYHQLFDFNPATFSRTTASSNWTIFGGLDPKNDPDPPYKKYNPTDWVPSTATHYARSTTSDVIATQFVLRVACEKTAMQKALQKCPDCSDAIVMLSSNDEYKVFDVRIARVSSGQLEVSKIFKMVSVDCSGDMVSHSQVAQYYFGSVGGTSLRAKWRGELSGYMATTNGTYGGPTPLLIRLSSSSPSY
jgi:hypothetical protein